MQGAPPVDTGGKIAAGINNTGSKFFTSINNIGSKFATSSACVVDTGDKFATAPVSTIPAANLPSVSTALVAYIRNTIRPQAP